MKSKTTGIILTILTIIVCGCPGIFSFCLGAIFAFDSLYPSAFIDGFEGGDPRVRLIMGLGSLCLGVVLVAIPFFVGFLTLRKKNEPAEKSQRMREVDSIDYSTIGRKEKPAEPEPTEQPEEPIPPAI